MRLTGFFFFRFGSSDLIGLVLGHLTALVGGLGRLLVGAGIAVARLANNKGALGVSATVSATTVGAGVEGGTTALGSSTTISVILALLTGIGGLLLKSSTRLLSSSMS